MSAAQQGRIDSEETRRLKSEVAKKRPPMSEEVRRRISETKKRQQLHTVHTAETRCKIKESLAGRCTRTTTNKGMVYSAVAKANFSEAQKARWADPKKRAALMEARAR